MSELEFTDDVDAKKFKIKVDKMLNYLKKNPNHEMYETAVTILNDNIKMYEKINEGIKNEPSNSEGK